MLDGKYSHYEERAKNPKIPQEEKKKEIEFLKRSNDVWKRIKEQLADPSFQEIKTVIGEKPKGYWYSWAGGPEKIDKLANCVGLSELYNRGYGLLSLAMHARDLGNQSIHIDGDDFIKPLRQSFEAKLIISITQNCLLLAMEKIRRFYRPNEDKKFILKYVDDLPDSMKKVLK